MSSIIRILSDSVANQIAAGEVVQRPASVVKELLENAIDAKAKKISLNLTDSGKTLIQVVDDGVGMSEEDARLAFERHATSKISSGDDLSAIQTKGFRGEALASIASIGEVELKTRHREENTGHRLVLSASKIIVHEPVQTPVGSNFAVRSLFFNVPARRKFLKSKGTEQKHIINEFQRVALPHNDIAFSLQADEEAVYNLRTGGRLHRIVSLFGKQMEQRLLPVEATTAMLKVSGFVSTPQFAKKNYGEQFFFTNNRFMKSPFFHKAVMQAYDNLLLPNTIPSYFIFFEIDPAAIDINIHPTKTEIKFENDSYVWQVLKAAIRESLGRSNFVSPVDFENDSSLTIPPPKSGYVTPPPIPVDTGFDPFRTGSPEAAGAKSPKQPALDNWDLFYQQTQENRRLFDSSTGANTDVSGKARKNCPLPLLEQEGKAPISIGNNFIIAPVRSGMMLLHRDRAIERIAYDQLMQEFLHQGVVTQPLLFPKSVSISTTNMAQYQENEDMFSKVGIDARASGKAEVMVYGLPALLQEADTEELLNELLSLSDFGTKEMEEQVYDKIALIMARSTKGKLPSLPEGEGNQSNEGLIRKLFSSEEPDISPSGAVIYRIISSSELSNLLSL